MWAEASGFKPAFFHNFYKPQILTTIMATASIEDVKKELGRIGKNKKLDDPLVAQCDYVYKLIDSTKDEKLQRRLRVLLTPRMLKGKSYVQYLLGLDTMTEGLESSYYWILSFWGDKFFNQNYKIRKAQEYFAATETSYIFGDMGARRTNLEKRAQELLALINQLIRTIINILWDLREFEIRIERYNDLESKDKEKRRASDLALKSIWLSEVDMKKGAGSINNLVQQLNFVTLRDAFMFIDTMQDKEKVLTDIGEKDENVGMDLPMIVKRILLGRVTEYLDWRELSKKELTKRFEIEKAYLRHEVASMKLYTAWVRPYLFSIKRLTMPTPDEMAKKIPDYESETSTKIEWGTIYTSQAELVTTFETAQIFVELFGTKEVTKEFGGAQVFGDDKIYGAIEADFVFRTLPGQVDQRRYMQRGALEMIFTAYSLDERRKKDLERIEEDDVLKQATKLTEDTLLQLRDDLAHFDADDVEAELPNVEVPKAKFGLFGDIAKPFTDAAEGLGRFMPSSKKQASEFVKQKALKYAGSKAKKVATDVYDKFKKMKGMYTWI